MITRPDEYGHQNPDEAFVDGDHVRGGRRAATDRQDLYALASKADQLKVNVTIVRILVDDEHGGATTEVLLVDAARIGEAAGWQDYALPATSAGGRPAPLAFTNQTLVTVRYAGAYPPLSEVYNEDGDLLICQKRIDQPGKTMAYEFSEPTTGIIIF